MIGSYVVEIGQKAKTSATQILLVESSNPKLVRSIKIKFQAMQYLDEPWMEDDMDEEIEKSVATESQPAVSDTKWELPTKTGHVCIMSINASGKPVS